MCVCIYCSLVRLCVYYTGVHSRGGVLAGEQRVVNVHVISLTYTCARACVRTSLCFCMCVCHCLAYVWHCVRGVVNMQCPERWGLLHFRPPPAPAAAGACRRRTGRVAADSAEPSVGLGGAGSARGCGLARRGLCRGLRLAADLAGELGLAPATSPPPASSPVRRCRAAGPPWHGPRRAARPGTRLGRRGTCSNCEGTGWSGPSRPRRTWLRRNTASGTNPTCHPTIPSRIPAQRFPTLPPRCP